MKKNIAFLIAFFILGSLSAQQITLSGFVEDKSSAERLVSATVQLLGTTQGVITNNFGYFSVKVKSNEKTSLLISYTGFEPQQIDFSGQNDSSLVISLSPITLQEVEVKASRPQHGQQLGKLSPHVAKLQEAPAIMGEKDIIKSMALLPGITGGQEGTAALYVRGGSPDQNLFLLDDAVIFNPFHLFGLVSTFNGDAIKNVDIYKGNFPARYGGRLSSVIDMTMREGNRNETEGKLDVGIISSKGQIEGPVDDGCGSYFLSARSSYLNLLTLPFNIAYRLGTGDYRFNYWLYDINAKINYKFSDTDHIYLSLYNSNDTWQVGERSDRLTTAFNLNWGNTVASLRHNKKLRKGLFWKNTLSYSTYRYQSDISNIISIEDPEPGQEATEENSNEVGSSVSDSRLKTELFIPIYKWIDISAGLEAAYLGFKPFVSEVKNSSTDQTSINRQVLGGQEVAAYMQTNFEWGKYWSMSTGFRYVNFFVEGANYQSPEYRFNINREGLKGWNWSLAYAKTSQFLHLLNANSVGLPNDVWLPSTQLIPPSRASQTSLGFSKSSKNRSITFSSEAYIRNMTSLIDYSRSSLLQLSPSLDWENELATNGMGFAYGFENMITLDYKNWDAWVSYTWARSERKFLEINEGDWYPSSFDKTHDLSVMVNYDLNASWKFNAVWNFQTGRPFTAPIAIIDGEWGDYMIYGDRNNARLPAFHRLDLGATYSFEKKGRDRTWSFGVINAYNHINPNVFAPELLYLDEENSYTNYRGIGFIPVLPYVSFGMNLFKNK
ncbi:carboxypeptidase-like regulatory domain-containing protein [Marivirga salinae]|uniref:Carboxypeptidase-like regulatory domain-containing protein n=1 Tax=Marivirga salinarum TaxID=3059078 RepID=A0AA51ND47_9BACT|nr:carboxypeptidase-like regulatory domain-containing protein [Marivirga sp. BDSF4-3]WMN11381.1 carboxypeptidase-like regulatory domain-containing protein [Marivirga sp. BDSF4-3]